MGKCETLGGKGGLEREGKAEETFQIGTAAGWRADFMAQGSTKTVPCQVFYHLSIRSNE
jgi:hypothetical protein